MVGWDPLLRCVAMLRLVAYSLQGLLAGLAGYNLIVAAFGWKNRAPAAASARDRRFLVLIPAHDEEAVVGNLLSDLAAQDYRDDLIDVTVVADHCSDATTAVARDHGVTVAERSEGVPGKGEALSWYLDRESPGAEDVVLVLDADNRVSPDLLPGIADEVAAGYTVVQCYLDVANPDASLLATANALSYWAGSRMVQLARDRLVWGADLGGTGMAFTGEALGAIGGIGGGLTEDQDLSVRAALADRPPSWLHHLRVYDEKPVSVGASVRQRARWMRGKRAVASASLGALWSEALRRPSLRLFDVGLRLVQPGRSFVALVSGLLAVLAAATRSRLLFPWPVWGAIAGLQFLSPLPFLARDHVAPRYLVRYPLLALLAALWFPIRIASSFVRRWVRTEHVG